MAKIILKDAGGILRSTARSVLERNFVSSLVSVRFFSRQALKVRLNDGVVTLDNNVTEGALCSFCLHKLQGSWRAVSTAGNPARSSTAQKNRYQAH